MPFDFISYICLYSCAYTFLNTLFRALLLDYSVLCSSFSTPWQSQIEQCQPETSFSDWMVTQNALRRCGKPAGKMVIVFIF